MARKNTYITGNSCGIDISDDLYVDFTAECSIDNDGIGHYEYCGQNCFDAGHDYVVCDGEIEWDKTIYSDEENKAIEEYVALNEDAIAEKISDNATKECDDEIIEREQ